MKVNSQTAQIIQNICPYILIVILIGVEIFLIKKLYALYKKGTLTQWLSTFTSQTLNILCIIVTAVAAFISIRATYFLIQDIIYNSGIYTVIFHATEIFWMLPNAITIVLMVIKINKNR